MCTLVQGWGGAWSLLPVLLTGGHGHWLVATSVTVQDEGTYLCQVGEDSVDFRSRVCG